MGQIKLGGDNIHMNIGQKFINVAYVGDNRIYYARKKKIVAIVSKYIIVFEDDFSYNVYNAPNSAHTGTILNNYIYMYCGDGRVRRTNDFLKWETLPPSVTVSPSNSAREQIYSNNKDLLLVYGGGGSPCIINLNTMTKVELDNTNTDSLCRISSFDYNRKLGHFIGFRKGGYFREYGNDGSIIKDHITSSTDNACAAANTFGSLGNSNLAFWDNNLYDLSKNKIVFTSRSDIGVVRGGEDLNLATLYVDTDSNTKIVEFSEDGSGFRTIYSRLGRYTILQAAYMDGVCMELYMVQNNNNTFSPPLSSIIFRKSNIGSDTFDQIVVNVDPITVAPYPKIDVMNVSQ